MRSAPHYDHPRSTGYDGQFYAQLARIRCCVIAAIDQALDNPPYRAHRILFSWIAWALGAGRPAWILQAASLENVLAWLVLAWVLALLIPPDQRAPLRAVDGLSAQPRHADVCPLCAA